MSKKPDTPHDAVPSHDDCREMTTKELLVMRDMFNEVVVVINEELQRRASLH